MRGNEEMRMKRTLIYGLMALLAAVLFSSCPLVYPGGGSVTFVGTNELGTSYTAGDIKITLTGDGNDQSYSETTRFGVGGTSFTSLTWVESGNYSLRITVKDGAGNFLTDNTDWFWLSEGEQKRVTFTVFDDGTSPRLSFDAITSEGGSSNFWVENSGAGMIWRWDYDVPNPANYQSYHQIAAWGNLENLAQASVRYPDGRGVDYLPGSRNLDVTVMQDDSGNFIGFNRKDYGEYGFYSWELTDSSGGKTGGEALVNPTWTSDNVARMTGNPIMAMSDVDINWMIMSLTDVDSLVGLAVHRDSREIHGAAVFDPSVGAGTIYPSVAMFSGEYDIILLTLDAPLSVDQINNLWDVSQDSVATMILMLPDGPDQVGVHAISEWI